MTPNSQALFRRRTRQWFSDRCVDTGTFFYRLCERLDTGPFGEVCPDCNVPVVVNKDGTCPQCNDMLEQKRRDEQVMAGAFDDGYAAALRSRQGEGDW